MLPAFTKLVKGVPGTIVVIEYPEGPKVPSVGDLGNHRNLRECLSRPPVGPGVHGTIPSRPRGLPPVGTVGPRCGPKGPPYAILAEGPRRGCGSINGPKGPKDQRGKGPKDQWSTGRTRDTKGMDGLGLTSRPILSPKVLRTLRWTAHA